MRGLFLKSVIDNDIDKVKVYLNDPNFEKEWMDTLDLSSIIKKSADIAVLLIQKGINIDIKVGGSGKPLLAYAIENKLDALIDAILVRSDLNINETFDQTFYHQDDPDPTIVRISLLSYALINKADKVIKLLLQNPDLIIHSNDNCMSVFRYLKQDPDIKPSEHLIQGLIINSSTHILRNNTDYLIKVNFNWTTKFDNGETILHLLVKKSFGPTLFKPILVYVHYLLQHNTPSNEPLVKVNLRDNNGNRAIDLLGNSHNEFITLLRNHGSVEPKEPIGDPSFKLILDDGSGYAPDGIPGNKAKAEKILQLMFGKYALTDQEINDEIIEFKKIQNC